MKGAENRGRIRASVVRSPGFSRSDSRQIPAPEHLNVGPAEAGTTNKRGVPQAMTKDSLAAAVVSPAGLTTRRCAKCGFVNHYGADVCCQCGAHIYLTCRLCGKGNERIAEHCVACGSRLHPLFWQRWKQKARVAKFRLLSPSGLGPPWWLPLQRKALQWIWLVQLAAFVVGLILLVLFFRWILLQGPR